MQKKQFHYSRHPNKAVEVSFPTIGENSGPVKLEMFARSRDGFFPDYEYAGWDVYGNQVNKFNNTTTMSEVKTMTAHDVCSMDEMPRFTIGKSKIVWESASYPDGSAGNNVLISRVVGPGEGGKPFMLGLFYKSRYVKRETVLNIVQ